MQISMESCQISQRRILYICVEKVFRSIHADLPLAASDLCLYDFPPTSANRCDKVGGKLILKFAVFLIAALSKKHVSSSVSSEI